MTRKNKLTNKQRAFIEHYLECWNATEAARKAGYQGNSNTLGTVGAENLLKPNIRRRIEERLKTAAMSADEVLSRLSRQARGDMANFINLELRGGKLDLEKAEKLGLLHLIKKVSWTKQGTTIELYDAQSALEKLARVHGLFTERRINFDIDLENCTVEQLARLAAGENPLNVLQSEAD
jgi:phage terminase small subunit